MRTLILLSAVLALSACSTSNLKYATGACEKGTMSEYYERKGNSSLEFACRKLDDERRIRGVE